MSSNLLPCPKCHGLGIETKRDHDQYVGSHLAQHPCTKCKGVGWMVGTVSKKPKRNHFIEEDVLTLEDLREHRKAKRRV